MEPLGLLRLKGADTTRFLQGQVTQDLQRASTGELLPGLLLNRLGKVEFVVGLQRLEAAWLIDVPLRFLAELQARLERYIISDDVEVMAEQPPAWVIHLEPSGQDLPAPDLASGQWTVRSLRWGRPALEIWASKAGEPPGWAVGALDQASALLARGWPRWPTDFGQGLFPQQAGLDGFMVSFSKGCYLGQEVVSRIQTAGKLPSRLFFWRAEQAPSGGCRRLLRASDGLLLGEVNESWGPEPIGGGVAGFALLRPGSLVAEDSVLIEGDEGARISAWVCPAPFCAT